MLIFNGDVVVDDEYCRNKENAKTGTTVINTPALKPCELFDLNLG